MKPPTSRPAKPPGQPRTKVEGAVITRAQLAALARVTPQMIVKYEGLGLPSVGKARYRQAEALAWIKDNVPKTGHGGPRKGGGRPPTTKAASKATALEGVATSNPESTAAATAPTTAPTTETDQTFRQLQTRKLEIAARLSELEVARMEGRVVDRETTIVTVRTHLLLVRQTVERTSSKSAKRIGAELRLSPEQVDAVRSLIDEDHRDAFARLAKMPLPLEEESTAS